MADPRTVAAMNAAKKAGYEVLSPLCLRVLAAVARLRAERGRPPTVQEVTDHCGFASLNALTEPLRKLRDAGLLVLPAYRSLRASCRLDAPPPDDPTPEGGVP